MSGGSDFTLAELKSVYQKDEESFREVLSLFTEDAPPRLERLEAALRGKDSTGAATAAHGLANVLGALRNYEGAAAARATEAALNEGDLPRAEMSASICRREVEATLRQIEEELA